MCLTLANLKKLIATQDIVCYKELNKKKIPNMKNVPHDARFKGTIRGINCVGKISVEEGLFYFCTNNPRLNGKRCSNKLEFLYSWVLDMRVEKVVINDVKVDNSNYSTRFRNYFIEIGEVYTSKLGIPFGNEINIGMHSYAFTKDCDFNNYVIAECIIPKGSSYYIGEFSGKQSYASDAIHYLKIIS